MNQGYLKKGKNCQIRTVEKCAFLKSMAQEKYSIFIKVTGGFLCICGQFGVIFGKILLEGFHPCLKNLKV